MVVTEALARGLPVITTSGGALADTLPPAAGMTLPPGDALALRDALARWLDDPDWRRQLRQGARQARAELGDWQQAGERFVAARSPKHWRLLDHDTDLLAHARRRSGRLRDLSGDRVRVDTSCRDLAKVDEDFLAGSDLVVASALFDLVSRSWVESLVQACARKRQVMLITLSVDGDWAFLDPRGQHLEDGEDIAVRTLFKAHQLRNKGLGTALGGEAPAVLTTCLTQAGYPLASDRRRSRGRPGRDPGHWLA